MSLTDRAVYYAVNEKPVYSYQLRRSIVSLREHNADIQVYVVFDGQADEELKEFLAEHRVELVDHPARASGYGAYFLKWSALAAEFEASELLFLDTDTVFFGDVAKLFELGSESFQAREEKCCWREPDGYPFQVGVRLLNKSQVKYEMFDRVCEMVGAEPLTVFNTGVMIFKDDLRRQIVERLPCFSELHESFAGGQLPYPCRNPHILEEVVAAIILGTIPDLSWRRIEPAVCPSYEEYRGRTVADKGVLLHIWSNYYPVYLFEFEGFDEMRKYRRLMERTGLFRRLGREFYMILSGPLQLPRSILEMWFRRGERKLSPQLRGVASEA